MTIGHATRSTFPEIDHSGDSSTHESLQLSPPDSAQPVDPSDHGREDEASAGRSAAYQRIKQQMGCEPPWEIWKVSNNGDGAVEVWASQTVGDWPCPVCARMLPRNTYPTPTHVFRRRTCRTETYVCVKIPIIDCPEHGRAHVTVAWTRDTDRWRYVRTLTPVEDDAQRSGA